MALTGSTGVGAWDLLYALVFQPRFYTLIMDVDNVCKNSINLLTTENLERNSAIMSISKAEEKSIQFGGASNTRSKSLPKVAFGP